MLRFQFSLRSLVLASVTIPAILSTCLNRDPFVKVGNAIDDGECKNPHPDQILFAKDGRVIASGEYGGLVVWKRSGVRSVVYQVESRRNLKNAPHPQPRPTLTPDGAGVLYVNDGRFSELNFETNADTPYPIKGFEINRPLVFRPGHKGDYLVFRTWDGVSATHEVVLHFGNGSSRIVAKKFNSIPIYSPDGKTFAATRETEGQTRGETLCIFDADTGAELRELPAYGYSAGVIGFSPDGSMLAVHIPGYVSVCDAKSAKEIFEYKLNEEFNFNFTPDGDAFYTLWKGEIRFRSLADRSLLYTLKTGKQPVWQVTFSADGAQMATRISSAACVTLNIWKRRLPFGWIAIFYMPEFWIALVFAPMLLWSLMNDRKFGTKENHVVEKSVV